MKRPADLEGAPRGGATPVATRRVVLLGASNLTRGLGTVLATAQRAWAPPLEVLAALGHGRSYGAASRVLGRELPGILDCGLWDELAGRTPLPTAALVTDIGNDVLYGEPVEHIEAWVAACLDRLAGAGARTVVTLLPVDNLATLSRTRFLVMRTLLVPRSRLSLEMIGRRVHALNERVRRLAVERGFGVVAQRADWYGFDPVHIRYRSQAGAWREILSTLSESALAVPSGRGSLARTLYLRSRVPQWRRLWGFEQRGRQPSAQWSDGTTMSLY